MEPSQRGALDSQSTVLELQSVLNSLRTELADAESLMKLLRGRIHSIQTALNKLETADLQHSQPQPAFSASSPSVHATRLSAPIHLLSSDVLLLIIQDATARTVIDTKPVDKHAYSEIFRRTAPWTYAAVCKNWRAVCLSSPLLWTKVTQWDIPRSCPGLATLQACRILAQLRRSGSSPLAGYISGIEPLLGVDPPEQELSALRGIVAAFPRFISLDLHGEMPVGILPNSSVSFDLLESLVVEGQWWLFRTPGALFQTAPVLETLTLRGMPICYETSAKPFYNLDIPWASITTLDISQIGESCAMHSQDLFRILRLTSRLSSLTISGSRIYSHADYWRGNRVTGAITLPSLRYLAMNRQPGDFSSEASSTMKVLKQLSAPQLRTLDPGNIMPTAYQDLIAFIQKSDIATTITSLTITVSTGTREWNNLEVAPKDDIRSLFPQLHSLQTLNLHGLGGRRSVVNVLLQTLTWSPQAPETNSAAVGSSRDSSLVCPELKEIHCLTGWKNVLDVPWNGLRNLVQSRITDVPGQHGLVHGPGTTASVTGQRESGSQKSQLDVISLLLLSRNVGDDVLQELSERDREAMTWLINGDRSGVFELRLPDIENEDRLAVDDSPEQFSDQDWDVGDDSDSSE